MFALKLYIPVYTHVTGIQTHDSKSESWGLAVWGWARYLSVMAAPHKTESLQVDGYGNEMNEMNRALGHFCAHTG